MLPSPPFSSPVGRAFIGPPSQKLAFPPSAAPIGKFSPPTLAAGKRKRRNFGNLELDALEMSVIRN